MGSMFPALDIKQPESPLAQYGQAMQIKSGIQQQQLTALQIQREQQDNADRHAMTAAMANWDGKDYGTLPGLVKNAGGSANAVFGMTKNVFAIKQQASEVAKNDSITGQNNVDTAVKTHDMYRGRILNIVGMADPTAKQSAWAAEIAKEQQAGTQLPPGITAQYPGDDGAKAVANSLALGTVLVKEADDRQKMALEAWKPSGGELVNVLTGAKTGGITDVAPLNAALQTRYRILNPGQPLPDYFTLKQNATPADFERLDKIMQQTESSKMTLAQQGVANAIRQQTYSLMEDKEGLKPVIGTDPKTGRSVAVPYSQAQQMGIKDAAEMPATEYSKTLSGRQWLQLALTQAPKGAPASDMGISQLLDRMDKAGKLGPLAGRWNDFMTAGWGSGDPDYAALRTKVDLSSTLLGSVHTGRLGPYLLENLASLAQTKKMDGPTLKSAFNTEISYVKDRAMNPNEPNYGAKAPGNAAPNAPQAGALPQGGGKVLDKATAQQFYQAAGNDPDKARALATKNGWQIPKAQ
jgi:hypothetical protein